MTFITTQTEKINAIWTSFFVFGVIFHIHNYNPMYTEHTPFHEIRSLVTIN